MTETRSSHAVLRRREYRADRQARGKQTGETLSDAKCQLEVQGYQQYAVPVARNTHWRSRHEFRRTALREANRILEISEGFRGRAARDQYRTRKAQAR